MWRFCPQLDPPGLSDLDVEMTDIPVPLTEYETTTSSTNKGKQPETELGEIRLAVLEGELWVEIEDYKKQKVGITTGILSRLDGQMRERTLWCYNRESCARYQLSRIAHTTMRVGMAETTCGTWGD